MCRRGQRSIVCLTPQSNGARPEITRGNLSQKVSTPVCRESVNRYLLISDDRTFIATFPDPLERGKHRDRAVLTVDDKGWPGQPSSVRISVIIGHGSITSDSVKVSRCAPSHSRLFRHKGLPSKHLPSWSGGMVWAASKSLFFAKGGRSSLRRPQD